MTNVANAINRVQQTVQDVASRMTQAANQQPAAGVQSGSGPPVSDLTVNQSGEDPEYLSVEDPEGNLRVGNGRSRRIVVRGDSLTGSGGEDGDEEDELGEEDEVGEEDAMLGYQVDSSSRSGSESNSLNEAALAVGVFRAENRAPAAAPLNEQSLAVVPFVPEQPEQRETAAPPSQDVPILRRRDALVAVIRNANATGLFDTITDFRRGFYNNDDQAWRIDYADALMRLGAQGVGISPAPPQAIATRVPTPEAPRGQVSQIVGGVNGPYAIATPVNRITNAMETPAGQGTNAMDVLEELDPEPYAPISSEAPRFVPSRIDAPVRPVAEEPPPLPSHMHLRGHSPPVSRPLHYPEGDPPNEEAGSVQNEPHSPLQPHERVVGNLSSVEEVEQMLRESTAPQTPRTIIANLTSG
jgi:hypothetical protein